MSAFRSRRLVAPAAIAIFALSAASAEAAPQTVVGGNLNWSTVNVYNSTTPNVDQTFVGRWTRTGSQGSQNATLSPTGAAWGTTVGPTSAQGTPVSWNFPAVNGVYDPKTRSGTVSTIGRVQALSPNVGPNVGFNYTLSIGNPSVVFDGTKTARLYGEGTKYAGSFQPAPADNTVSYGRAELFTLDLSQAVETQGPDGTITLSNLVPTVVTDVYGGFPAGAGPNRTPNTFGGFSLSFRTFDGPVGPKGDKGDVGPAGANGKNGKNGKKGKNGKSGKNGKAGATRVIASLAKAPWTGSKARKVSLLKGKTIVASGSLKKRTLTVTVAKGKTVAAGRYTVKLQGSKAKKTIRIG